MSDVVKNTKTILQQTQIIIDNAITLLLLPLVVAVVVVVFTAMHFSAKRGIAIACRLSVCPSVRLSVTLVNCDHIG